MSSLKELLRSKLKTPRAFFRSEVFLIFLIVAAGLALRLHNITARDYWYDESFTAILTSWNWKAMWGGILADVHPPVYYFLLKIFAFFFGHNPFSLRLFSALLSTANIYLVYLIAKGLLKNMSSKTYNLVALVAALLVAFSPFQIQYAQEARQYSLLGFWFLLSLFFIIKASGNKPCLAGRQELAISRVFLAISGVFLSLTFLTQYAGILAAPALLLFFGLVGFRGIKKFALDSLVLFSPLASTFTAWLPIFIRHFTNVGTPSWIPGPTLARIPQTAYTYLFGEWPKQAGASVPNQNIFGLSPLWLGIGILLILLAFLGYWLVRSIKSLRNLVPLAFPILFFLPLLESIFLAKFLKTNFYMERYLFPASFGLYLSLAFAVGQFKRGYLATATVFTFVILMLFIKGKPVDARFQNLAKDVPVGKYDQAVVFSPFDYPTAAFYLKGKISSFLVYNAGSPAEDVTGWVIIGQHQITNLEGLNLTRTLLIPER